MENVNLSTFSSDQGRENFKAIIEPLIQRTYEDAAFKKAFIAKPQEVIQKELGINVELPSNWRFEVRDLTDPFALYIHLPINEDDIELTDEELEVVAGGIKKDKEPKNKNCKGGNCVAGCGGSQ